MCFVAVASFFLPASFNNNQAFARGNIVNMQCTHTAWAINSLITRFPADLLEYFIVMLLFIKFDVHSCAPMAANALLFIFFSSFSWSHCSLNCVCECLRCCFCRRFCCGGGSGGDGTIGCYFFLLDGHITFSHSTCARPIIIPLNWGCSVPCHRCCSTLLARTSIYIFHTVNVHSKWSERKAKKTNIKIARMVSDEDSANALRDYTMKYIDNCDHSFI